jgi:hypothetical protein
VEAENRRPVVDRHIFGHSLRRARLYRFGNNSDAFIDAVNELGVRITRRMLYSYEKGEVMPALDVAVAMIVVLSPEGGIEAFFREAVAPDVMAVVEKIRRPPRAKSS